MSINPDDFKYYSCVGTNEYLLPIIHEYLFM